MSAPTGDAAVVERLQRRDPLALAELYDRYGRIAYSRILRVVRDGAAAEDLLQETFLRVWTHARKFHAERGAFEPWLLAVARNRTVDYLRSLSGRERQAVAWEDRDRPSPRTCVEGGILASNNARSIRAALLKLAPHQREAIHLAYFEGLTQTEVAERMGQPLGTVKTWMRTALKSLRHELGQTDWIFAD